MTDPEIERFAPVVARHAEQRYRLAMRHEREKAELLEVQGAELAAIERTPIIPPTVPTENT